MVKLVISDDVGATTVVPLVRDEISIGRGEGNTIRLTEKNVSRKHALLRRVGDTYVLKDLKSYNGLLVNSKPCTDEVELSFGDLIKIGDYLLTYEVDSEDHKDSASDQASSSTTSLPTPTRLVLWTPPAPGAEFSLRKEGTTRIGRSDDLDIPISHTSVSREHAEIRVENGAFRIFDLNSVNGVRINGIRKNDGLLHSGDIIELGEVVFRFVSEGESYHFDAQEVLRYIRETRRGWTQRARLIGITAIGLLILFLIVVWNRGWGTTQESPKEEAPIVEVIPDEESQIKKTSSDAEYTKSLEDCRAAIDGSRYAEAMAYAAKALETRPADKIAIECKRKAKKLLEQEQIFVRGKAALDQDDIEGAYLEFSKLDKDSVLKQTPEVKRTIEELAKSKIDLAWALIKSDQNKAVGLAASVLEMEDAPVEFHTSANEIKKLVQTSEDEVKPQVKTVKVASLKQKKVPKRTQPKTKTFKPQKATIPEEGSPSVASTISKSKKGQKSRFSEASACLAKGDNRCIIRLLDGKTKTSEELGLLIETYRSTGDTKRAKKNMILYVKRYPTSRRTGLYRRILERND